MPKIELNNRLLKEAKRQASMMSQRIQNFHSIGKLKSWDQLERTFKIAVPSIFKEKPFNWNNLCSGYNSFCSYWENSVEARLEAALNATNLGVVHKPRVVQDVSTFGKFTLKSDQEGVFRSIFDSFFPSDPNKSFEHAALQDGYPGLGKTVIGCAVIAKLFESGLLDQPQYQFMIQPVMIIAPRTVVEIWRRHLEDFGLGKYLRKNQIVIYSNGLFTSDFGKTYCAKVEDEYTDEVTLEWNIALIPLLVFLDESHGFNNPKALRTKAMMALHKKSKITRFCHFSATPGEKVNDMFLLTVQARKNLLGTFVDENSFKYFSQLITPRPDKASRGAMEKYRKVMLGAGVIHSAPWIKPKYKAINVLWLAEFPNPKSKEIYDTAVERYVEACRKGGKNTAWGRFQRNVELAIMWRTVEPLRAPALAERAAENYRSGNFATAIGVQFKETISSVAFILADQYNIGREHISVIWGGRKEFKKEDIIPKHEMDRLIRNPSELMKLIMNKAFRRRFAISIKYEQDQIEHNENFEEQSERHHKLRELKLLGGQSLNTRQIEIDNFQDNTTRICLFTAATGGVGLSLDRNRVDQLIREGLFSMGTSGKIFKQLLGRLVRRNSISDAIQRICAMRDSVEHWFLAPLMDRKLKSIAELTASDMEMDIEELMSQQPAAKDYAAMSLQEAISRAEEDEDTVVSDITNIDAPTDEDNADDNEADEIIGDVIDEEEKDNN